jgi:uncharacterized protein
MEEYFLGYICSMSTLLEVKKILQRLKPLLATEYHVCSVGLFGSIVREDFSLLSSDIDIIVDFSRPVGIEFIDLANFIEEVLKRKVDLVSKKGIKEKYFSQIEQEIVYV